MKWPVVALFSLLSGCASMSDALTPSALTLVDQFDGNVIVRQSPVEAASNIGEPSHILGFEWNQKFPDIIFITAGSIRGPRPIQNIAFNADGTIIENLKPATNLTDVRESRGARRFEMPLAQFQAIASAKVVKMRLEASNAYTVSSFGSGSGTAIVNLKFTPFLEKVRAARLKR